jgi:D-beta-D-heptose 7-phosphate kinase/D-beta-D-heptose 1-phosphate adenosyltransferase
VERLSPEAPVPVLRISHSRKSDGMAGNVYNNLLALGVDAIPYFPTTMTTKMRYIDAASGQHLLRVDHDCVSQACDPLTVTVTDDIAAIVISDYNKGFVSVELIEYIQNKYSHIPIFIDTKKQDLNFISECCYVKINEPEYKLLKSPPPNLIVTQGSQSVLYNNKEFQVPHIPITDVTGAGDTFLASLAYQYVITKDINAAIHYAIAASGVTVTKLGVYAPTQKEIECHDTPDM